MLELSMLPHLNAFGFHLVHIWVILGSPWVHIWVTFGARIARQACATNWASKEEMKINEFPDCRRFPKLFQRSAFRNDDPESFDLETVISPYKSYMDEFLGKNLANHPSRSVSA